MTDDPVSPSGTAAVSGGARPRRHDRAWKVFAAAGLVLTAVYALDVSLAVSALVWAVIAVGTIVALAAGPRLHRVRLRRPWWLFVVACTLFLLGALLREVLAGSAALWLPDLFTLPGYGVLLAGLVVLQHPETRGAPERHALTDSLVVGVGAALAVLVLFALPAAAVPGRPPWLSVLAGGYPLIDIVLLLVLLHLAFTSAVREPSFWLLMTTMVALLIGDTGYAAIGAQGDLVGPTWLNIPFVVAYVAFGAAALHPSMAALSEARPRPVQAWSFTRLLLIVPALAVPAVLLLVRPPGTVQERSMFAATMAATTGLLLVRALSAVASYARTQAVLRHQANHDPLTGLANRRLLQERVDAMLAGQDDGPTVYLLFLDLDAFKVVNDLWGHEMGDELLVEVSRRLAAIADESAVVARIGGDEFILAATAGAAGGSGTDLAELILIGFAEPFVLSVGAVTTTPSIGVASWRRGSAPTTAEGLVRDADIAMYQAKKRGRNQYAVFDIGMHEKVRVRAETESTLRHALGRDEFVLHYQPIVDLYTERPAGYEALLRWNHPDRGQVPPNDFVPVAEDTGLIVKIGEWVLRSAVEQIAQWHAEGPADQELFMSVNVSTRQLRDEGLVDAVHDVLLAHRVPAHLLHLEITESAMMDDPDTATRVLSRLRNLGVTLSVDDFGTGYSSLAYLRRFPVSVVKIDRSFVTGLGTKDSDVEIVRAVVAMAHSLGLEVIAEGVETVQQRNLLRRLGADRAQGWLYGRPVLPALVDRTAADPTTTAGSSASEIVRGVELSSGVGENS